MWLIEEKAKIFRRLVWLNAFTVLVTKETMITAIKNAGVILLTMIISIGAIFCQVSRIREFVHLNPSITSGNQKWKGAAPIFVSKAEFNIIVKNSLVWGATSSSVNSIIITAVSKIMDAMAWVMKYFNEDSEDIVFFLSENRGITERRLISSPIHILNQEYEEAVIMVPSTMKLMKINLCIFIKKGRGLLSWTGYEPVSLVSLPFYALV